jgi:hypothetical protein
MKCPNCKREATDAYMLGDGMVYLHPGAKCTVVGPVKPMRQCERCEQPMTKKLLRCPVCHRLVCKRCTAFSHPTFRLCKDCAA